MNDDFLFLSVVLKLIKNIFWWDSNSEIHIFHEEISRINTNRIFIEWLHRVYSDIDNDKYKCVIKMFFFFMSNWKMN